MKENTMDQKTFIKKVQQKADSLAALIIGIQKHYLSAPPANRRFIETTIGAAIWYLPKNKELLFTGMISEKALMLGERSEEHLFPRKIAAQELLGKNWSEIKDPSFYIAELFVSKYGRYNYVSKAENRKLIKFQKSGVFTNPDEAYSEAGVVLIRYHR